MSIDVMSWVWKLDIPARDKLVLLALADHADDEGYCWPGIKGIARKARMSDRAIQRHAKSLQEHGLLLITPQHRPDGSQFSNFYQILMPSPSPSMSPQLSPRVSPPGVIRTPPPDISDPVTIVTPPGDSGVTVPVTVATPLESSEEPSIEPSKKETSKERKKTVFTGTGGELLNLFAARDLLKQFPGVDHGLEAERCVTWWKESGRPMKRPETAYLNWLMNDKKFRGGEPRKTAIIYGRDNRKYEVPASMSMAERTEVIEGGDSLYEIVH